MTCDCGNSIHPERIELGLNYCLTCAKDKTYRAPVVILGQHKGQPLVFSPNDPIILRQESGYKVK